MARKHNSEANLPSEDDLRREPLHSLPDFGDTEINQLAERMYREVRSCDYLLAKQWEEEVKPFHNLPLEQRFVAALQSLGDLMVKQLQAAEEDFHDLVEKMRADSQSEHKSFDDLGQRPASDLQFQHELQRCEAKILRIRFCMARAHALGLKYNLGRARARASYLTAKDEKRNMGPSTKREHVKKRHEAMDKAIVVGIEEGEELHEYMIRAHPHLMYPNKRMKDEPKKDYISRQQMMRLYNRYRKSKKPE